MIRLKHCPFCGKTPSVSVVLVEKTGRKEYAVSCVNELCQVKPAIRKPTEQEAIRIWNRRYAFPKR